MPFLLSSGGEKIPHLLRAQTGHRWSAVALGRHTGDMANVSQNPAYYYQFSLVFIFDSTVLSPSHAESMNSRILPTNTKLTYPTSRSVGFVINDNVVVGPRAIRTFMK